jgi:uncharacterized protein YndB with AHSA1/START domain
MTERSEAHGSFTITRRFKQPPARVFGAFSDFERKQRWFGGNPPDAWQPIEQIFEFRPGGREKQKGRWVATGRVSDFDAVYLDIVPNERIVLAYEMRVDETKISVSLQIVTLEPDGAGTKLTHTEHGVFLDGYDDSGSREHGTAVGLDLLEASLVG